MDAVLRKQAERELELHNRIIKAAEGWSKQYGKDPDTHSKLIKAEAKLERLLRGYFRELSDRASQYIDWYAYAVRLNQIKAADFTVDVIVLDDGIADEDGLVMKVLFDPIASTVALGAQAGENIYKKPMGLTSTSEAIQQTTKEQVANLVGKRVTKHGEIIDNPKAKYRISDQTRKDIRHSIATSLSLGENQQDAAARLAQTVKDYRRAELIARTEAVNGYQGGLQTFGVQSGAVGKEWQTLGADDICAENEAQGIIGIDEDFTSGDSAPAAHPNCRCSLRLVYQEELQQDF